MFSNIPNGVILILTTNTAELLRRGCAWRGGGGGKIALETTKNSSIRVFSNESFLCIRWPKYWSFSFSISPSSEYSGLISSRMDWLDLLAVQGTCPGPLPSAYISLALVLVTASLALIECLIPATDNAKQLTCIHNNPMRSVAFSLY